METCTLDIQLQFDPVQLWIRQLRPVSFVFSLKRPYFDRKSKSIGSNWRNTIRLIRVIGPRHAPVNRWNTVVSRWFDNSIPFFFFLGRPCSPIPRAFSAISNQPLDLPFRGVPAFNCLLPARASMPRLFASSVCSKEMLTSCPHDWWTSMEEEAWNVIVQLLFLVPRKSTISCIEGTIVLWIRDKFFQLIMRC